MYQSANVSCTDIYTGNIMFIYGNSAFRDKDNKKDNAPHIKNDKKLIFHFFEEAVDSSINTALKLGAYVIIFSVIVNIIMHFHKAIPLVC